jgi:hypothetical protein
MYVEELEDKLKRMEDDLKRRDQFGESSQEISQDSIPSEYSPGISRRPPESHRPGNMANDQLSQERVSLRDQETSLAGDGDVDQPSYVIQSQDGKMRFYGWSSHLLGW